MLILSTPTALLDGNWVTGAHACEVRGRARVTTGYHRALVQGRTGFTLGQHVSVAQGGSAWRRGRHISRALGTSNQARAGMPVTPMAGRIPARLEVSCLLGRALKASYEHTGEDETATLTLRTDRASIPASLSITAALAGQGFTSNLSVDPRQWEEKTENGLKTTTIRLFNEVAYRAQSEPLPELIPWAVRPRVTFSDGTGPALRSVGVSSLVQQAAALLGLHFALLGNDPFGGASWLETVRDYSTGGKTFAALFGDTYGAAGYRLIVRGTLLFGLPPGQSITPATLDFTPCELRNSLLRAESGQVPGRIRVTGADRRLKVPGAPAVPTAPTATDQTDTDRAQSWLSDSTDNGVQTISAGYVLGGLVRETQEVSLGRVEVQESVDGELQTRTFDHVIIGDTRTTYTYHPENPEALVSQTTYKKSYGYGLGTQVQPQGVLGSMFSAYLSAGDLIGDETETVQQQWYEAGENAGYLQLRRTEGRRLISTQQQSAEETPDQRGAMQPREYALTVQVDEYRKVGALWHRQWSVSGGNSLPVYDQDTQEAVRLALKTGTQQRGAEVMRNEPPKVSWPVKAGQNATNPAEAPIVEEIAVPLRVQYAVSGGGFGVLSQDFPMLTGTGELDTVAHLLAAANGPRLRQEVSTGRPRAVMPGDGNVDSLSLEMDGTTRRLAITTIDVDAPDLSAIPWPAERAEARPAVVMSQQGQQVQVKALDVLGQVAEWVDTVALAATGTTFKPGQSVRIAVDSGGRNIITGG